MALGLEVSLHVWGVPGSIPGAVDVFCRVTYLSLFLDLYSIYYI